MASIWKINGTPSDALKVAGIKRERRSFDADTCTFEAPGRQIDAAPLFTCDEVVTITRAGVPWFVGRVTLIPATGTAEAESQSYTLSGPWWWLEHLAARQEWHTANGTGGVSLSGRLILGQALDGTRLTTGGTLTELLGYATDCGAPLVVGTIDPDIYVPLDEVKDITIADAIRHVMRWHPDCVGWFDYATTPHPTFHIRRRGNLGAHSFALGLPPLSAVSGITARKDLQVPAVVIHYEQTGSDNGAATFKIVTDAYPAGATGRELNALCVTLPLRGINATTVEQRIEVRGIRDDLDAYTSDEIRDYLLAYVAGDLPTAAQDPEITADGITITSIQRGVSDQNQKVYDPDSDTLVAADFDPALTQHLLSGSITDSMMRDAAIRTQVHRLYFTYTKDTGTDGHPVLTAGSGTLDIRATNAGSDTDTPTTHSYFQVTNYTPGDTVPTGLAAACYASFNALQYSGSVTLLEQEASSPAGLGHVLNLTGGAAVWTAMNALVTSESIDVDTGTTTLTFGPAPHLGTAEMFDLLQVARPAVSGRQPGSPAANGTGMSGAR